MKSKDVVVGQTYLATVSGRRVPLCIEAVNPHGGWLGRNADTGRQVRIRSGRRLQHPFYPADRAPISTYIPTRTNPKRKNPRRPGPVHYAALDPMASGYVPACGASAMAGATTPDRRFVECKKCLRWLASTVPMPFSKRRKNPIGQRAPEGTVAPACEYPGCGRRQVWVPYQGWQCRNWVFHQAGQASGGRQVPPQGMLGSFQLHPNMGNPDPWEAKGDWDTLRKAQKWLPKVSRRYPGTYRIRPYKDAHSGYPRFRVERKRNPAGKTRRRRYDPGQRIRVRPGSGASSGMTGTIVPRNYVVEPKRGQQRGFPFLPGYYHPIDWTREAAIRFDAGVVGTMWKDRLELI